MNLDVNYLADQYLFWNLKKISYGHLILTDSRNKTHTFGNKDSTLRVKMKISKPDFSSKVLMKGSSGLAESYINGAFTLHFNNTNTLIIKNII